MIKDSETNIVYFSELLKSDPRYTETCNRITDILDKHEVQYDFLNATKDIWARDYLPIQRDINSFAQFRYEPSYLKDKLELQSDPKIVCDANGFNPKVYKINLDGGNIVKWHDKAMITDRIFTENQEYSDRNKLVADIESILEVEVVIIPQINSDFTGHADGLVRFYNKNTIIGNDRITEYKYWVKKMGEVLDEFGFDYIDMPMFAYKDRKYRDTAIGCYMNYLEVGDLIVFPIFEIPGNKDQQAINLIQNLYPQKKIEPININEIAKLGGLLNCITWTIKSNL